MDEDVSFSSAVPGLRPDKSADTLQILINKCEEVGFNLDALEGQITVKELSHQVISNVSAE
jgi:hypothetical protein